MLTDARLRKLKPGDKLCKVAVRDGVLCGSDAVRTISSKLSIQHIAHDIQGSA